MHPGTIHRLDRIAHGSAVESRWHAHRHAPQHVRFPAGVPQVVGDGRESVRLAAPDVSIAVTVAVRPQPKRDRRHELRIAHGARPAAPEVAAAVAGIEQLHGGDELFFEQVAPAALVGEAGERIEHVEIPGNPPVAGLLAVNAQHDRGWNPRPLLDRRQPGIMLAIFGGPAADEVGGDMPCAIGSERRRGIWVVDLPRLGAVETDGALVDFQRRDDGGDCGLADAGQARQIRKPSLVGLEASWRGGLDRPRSDYRRSGLQRRRTHIFRNRRERVRGLGQRGGAGDHQDANKERTHHFRHHFTTPFPGKPACTRRRLKPNPRIATAVHRAPCTPRPSRIGGRS